jgi:exosortase D (VPLPA-CTERM-specific)
MSQEEYSHGFIIPLITLYLLWRRRDALLASIGRPSWAGPTLILISGLMLIVGELSAIFILAQTGFIICLMGLVLATGGASLLRVTALPVAFLAFAIPLPYFIDSILSWRLQLVSSELGVAFIRLFGIPVYLEGNVIDLGTYKLQVVEACSGLRYLYPLLSLGFLAAYMFKAPLWQRAVVFLSAIPITIMMNSFRIGVIGMLVDRYGTGMAEGALHFFEGWVIFMACAAVLAIEILVLARVTGRRGFFEVFGLPSVEAAAVTSPGGRYRAPLIASVALIATLGVAAFFVAQRSETVPERLRFASFPMTLGEWRGRDSDLEPQIEHGLGLDDYILADYRSGDGVPVNFYIAYYGSQRKGVSPHSPRVCIPGGGWLITDFSRREVAGQPMNRVVIEKDDVKQIVYYWFEQRGRRIANEWVSKWYLLVDAIFRNRTDGALVRMITLAMPGEAGEAADTRLRNFLEDVRPKLDGYLPQ